MGAAELVESQQSRTVSGEYRRGSGQSSTDQNRHTSDYLAPAANLHARTFREWWSAFGLLIGDLLAFFLGIMVAGLAPYFVSTTILGSPYSVFDDYDLRKQVLILTCLSFALCAWFARAGHYTEHRAIRSDLADILSACSAGFVINGFVEFIDKVSFSRLAIVTTWVAIALLVPLARVATKRLLSALGIWVVNAVVVGKGTHCDTVKEVLTKERYLGYDLVWVGPMASIADHRRPSIAQRLDDLLRLTNAHMVIFVPSDEEMQYLRAIVDVLNVRMIPYKIVPPIDRLPLAGLSTQSFLSCDAVLLTVQVGLASPLSQATKRIFDAAVSILLLILLLPMFVILSLAIAADGGPICFAHERVGRHGRRFKCLKFRTMVPNAATVLERMLAANPEARREWATSRKLREDPRTTRLGAYLRVMSLDELPQLINVLRGEMSLVGPRPVVREELSNLYKSDHSYYLLVRPGITGLWQISGRNNIGYDRRVHLDAWYVRNWSLWNDITILAKTLPCVIAGRGAC